MPVFGLANSYSTTLSAAITASATSLTITSATNAPAVPFLVRIGSELIEVRARSSTTCSKLVRGAEGTTAATHASGAVVRHVLTAASAKSLALEPVADGGALVFDSNDVVTDSIYAQQ
jgi:hypothetical protein